MFPYQGGGRVRRPRFFDNLDFGLRPGVICHGLKIFDHDHDQNFNVFVVKWSKILTMTMAKIKIFHGQNIHLTMRPHSIGKFRGVSGHDNF